MSVCRYCKGYWKQGNWIDGIYEKCLKKKALHHDNCDAFERIGSMKGDVE